jgi:hypothetical protein
MKKYILSGIALIGIVMLTPADSGADFYFLSPGISIDFQWGVPYPQVIWIDGRWERRHGNWFWANGYWKKRPRYRPVWISGHWERRHGNRFWVVGHKEQRPWPKEFMNSQKYRKKTGKFGRESPRFQRHIRYRWR